MVRLGLCCQFLEEPIKFRRTTATHLLKKPRADALEKLDGLCRNNADQLLESIRYCSEHGIGCFRLTSPILPMKTHPELGYRMEDLPNGIETRRRFFECGSLARRLNIRLVFHPDQFVVLNSPNGEIVEKSIWELEYYTEVASWIGADVINIHGGGGYGNKTEALGRLSRNLSRLPPRIRKRLTLENDDRVYSPLELLPVCRNEGIPFVYDVHHHRCLPDGLDEETVTELAIATWNREPLFHISSPLEGWNGPKPHRHHDYIDLHDFPPFWDTLDVTVEVEAKAKELAIRRLQRGLQRRAQRRRQRIASGEQWAGAWGRPPQKQR